MISLSKKLLISLTFIFSSINLLALDIINLTEVSVSLLFDDPNYYHNGWGGSSKFNVTFINALAKNGKNLPIEHKKMHLQPKEFFTLILPHGTTHLLFTHLYDFGGMYKSGQQWKYENEQTFQEAVGDDFTIVITRDTSEIGEGFKTKYNPYNPDKLVTWSKKLKFTLLTADTMKKLKEAGTTLAEYMATRK